jgi:hypothetical protein
MGLLNWLSRRLGWPRRQPKRVLICMREGEMFMRHPAQIRGRCSNCQAVVGIYPSGQTALWVYPDLKIICQRCADPNMRAMLAPGSIEDAIEALERRG